MIDDLSPLAEFWDGTTLELLDQYGKDRADMGGDSEMRGFYSSLLQVAILDKQASCVAFVFFEKQA